MSNTKDHQRKDKKLFTPGPLGTSYSVKSAMLRDLGSRDVEFISLVKDIRKQLLDIAAVPHADFTVVPMQGSGTFAVESVFQTAVPRKGGKVLVLENGAYGKRMAKVCEVMGLDYHLESFPENGFVDVGRVENLINGDNSFVLVAMTHCETSSGVVNPVVDIGKAIKKHNPAITFFVDAMSSFGAIALDMEEGKVDYLVSSVNKCLEGVPGFSYIIARLGKLLTCKGNSRSMSLDAYDQYANLEKTSQFRFTPPTHTMLAFAQALKEFNVEGGLQGRAARYQQNRAILREGMTKMGFTEFLSEDHKGYIITSYYFPNDKHFNFQDFYTKLNERDQVIYPGKVLKAECFRIGTIGYLFPDDVHHLLKCIEEVCGEMHITLPIDNL